MLALNKSPAKRTILVIILLLILVAAIDQAWVTYWRRLIIAHDTTRILTPIESTGCPDYLAALNTQYAQNITPENNAAPLLLQIIGTEKTNPTWQTAIHKHFHLDPTPLPQQFQSLAHSLHDEKSDQSIYSDQEDAAATAPWSPKDHPQWAAWIQSNTHALDLLQSATARPKFYIPLLSKAGATSGLGHELLFGIPMQRITPYGNLQKIALARSMMRLDSGDFPGFREDLVTSAKLANLLSQSPTVLEYLVALALNYKVHAALQNVAASQKLTAPQAQTLLNDFAAMPALPPPAPQLDGYDRYFVLDTICKLARLDDLGSAAPGAPSITSFRTSPVNFNRCLRICNSYHDQLTAIFSDPSFINRKNALADLDASESKTIDDAGKIEQTFLALLKFSEANNNKLYTTTLAHRNLALTALHLRLHQLQTGHFPPTLADLTPPASSPTSQDSPLKTQDLSYTLDPFTEKPLLYHPEPETYLLYSVGPNEKDDHATLRTPTGPAAKDYDLIVHP